MSRDADERFAAFVDRESGELLRVAWYLTSGAEDARDLVQEALTRVYGRWATLQPGQEIGYVRRTMVNLQRDQARRRGRAALLPWHKTLGVGAGPPVPDHADHVVGRGAMAAALQHLPVRQRAVIVLRHACDLSERQVAQELGISVGAVKSAGSRGLAALRLQLLHKQSIEDYEDTDAEVAR
ncbi:SigE family RNA polymerase sigma factor [uncultured Serinicoccus sp.]|uniref:SigE family RNA polymerase sigma factor n=1 Tax=uncultured Serinicoccus sp. TaxID=735514 RepID=UPI002612704B|nr:SigE family RNA polymerase sigma factor [uncultured Serinicoccus sp.]